jgi:hypothetical protein
MSLTKISNNSLSAISSLPASIPTGALTLLSTQTASSSASIEFTSGIDSTYDSYIFKFINIDQSVDLADFGFNMSTDGGSNYNVTKTSTTFKAQHQGSSGLYGQLNYFTSGDLAQSTADQRLTEALEADVASASMSGYLQLFNPSSTTYVKHFIYTDSEYGNDSFAVNYFAAGYGNTTSAVNAVRFQFDSGTFDGIIKMYGVS